MNVLSPAEWGSRVDYDTWSDTPWLKDNIAIHWGGTHAPSWDNGVEAEKAILQSWERYHIDTKGWRGIAYGYAIGATGTVYRLRGRNNYGAHQGDEDHDGISNNKEVIPVVFIMGERSGPPTDAMWDSMSDLYAWLTDQPWTDGNLTVFGHKEIQPKPTACPGPDIMAGIQNQRYLATGWREPGDPVETQADAVRVARYQDGEDQAQIMASVTDPNAAIMLGRQLDILMQHHARLLEGYL